MAMAPETPRGGSYTISVVFGEDRTAKQMVTRGGMSLAEFTEACIAEWKPTIFEEHEAVVGKRKLQGLVENPTWFWLVADPGGVVTAQMFATVFAVGAWPAHLTLELTLKPAAQTEFGITPEAPIPGTITSSSTIPHPDAFMAKDHGFHDRLIYCKQELIANLLEATHAICGSEERLGIIRLHKHRERDEYAITVQDHGIGMSEQTLSEAFTYAWSRKERGKDIGRLKGITRFVDSVVNRYGVG